MPESELIEPWQHDLLIGHAARREQLMRLHHAARLPQCLLVSGIRGAGKATLCWRVIADLLYAGDTQRLAQSIENGTQLDVRHLHPEENKLIPVADLRAAVDSLRSRPVLGKHKILIVDSVDELLPAGNNILLKIIEEPPAWAYIFIITHNVYNVLPTIRSRAFKLRIPSLTVPQLKELRGALIPQHSANLALIEAVCEGSGRRYLSLQLPDNAREFHNVIRAVASPNPMDFVTNVEDILRRKETSLVYGIMRVIGTEFLHWLNGAPARYNLQELLPIVKTGGLSSVQLSERLHLTLDLLDQMRASERETLALNLVPLAEITDKWLAMHKLIR